MEFSIWLIIFCQPVKGNQIKSSKFGIPISLSVGQHVHGLRPKQENYVSLAPVLQEQDRCQSAKWVWKSMQEQDRYQISKTIVEDVFKAHAQYKIGLGGAVVHALVSESRGS